MIKDKIIYSKEFKNWFGDWEKVIKKIEKLEKEGVIGEYDYDKKLPIIENKKKISISNPLYKGVSKVMQGRKPMRVYHNSKNEFNQFKSNDYEEQEFYFTDSELVADTYGNIQYEVYLDIKNPFIYDFDFCQSWDRSQSIIYEIQGRINDSRSLKKDITFERYGTEYTIPANCDGFIIKNLTDVADQETPKGFNDEEYQEWLEEYCSTIYVVYDSKQIKLADGSNKTFDTNNPDIRFDKGGKVEDSKGKKISSEELTEIYNNKSNDKDFGNYLTYDGNDSQILEVVKRINRRRSPKVDLNYTRSYIDYLQQEAFKLAGDRKFARVVRMTFDPYFSAKDIQRNLQMSLREFLYDYSLSDTNNSDYAMWKGFEDKEFNDKVERFAKAYKIKIPESKNDMKEDFKKGGKVTWRNKYNKKYGFDKDESHSLKDISKKSGVSMKGLQQIYNKGIGAYKTNPSSVRPNVTSKEQWAMGRVYSAVMGGKASKVDAKELKMVKGGNVSSISYEDWKKAYINLNNEVDEKSLLLNKYPTNSSGLIEEKVRMSEKYQKVKKDFDKSFKKLQDFNKVSPKQYQKIYHNEKRASWRMAKGGKLRTFLEVNKDIMKLNEQSRSGKLSHPTYYKAYEKLRKEFESIKRYNSFPQQMKRFGASVKKADGYRSLYYYIGKNFDGVIFEDCCETCWWQVYSIDLMKDGEFEKQFGRKPRLQGLIDFIMEDQPHFDTKKEVINYLYAFDQEFEDQEQFIKTYGDSWKDGKNFAKGGYITEGDKQSDYATLSNEDKLKYVKKEVGSINGLPIKVVYEEWDRINDEEYVVQLEDPRGEHSIVIQFILIRTERDEPISIDYIRFTRRIYSDKTNEYIYWASAMYGNDSDFNRAFEDLKEKGEYIFNTIEDFEKFMRIIQLDRIVYNLGYDFPLPIKKKLVVTKDTSYYDLPNFKNIMKQIKKRFSKVWRSNSDERFATRNDKYKIDYKPYILNTEIIEGKTLSKIEENEDFDNYVRINLYYQEQKEPKYLGSAFSVSGNATYLANGQFYNLKIDISDSSWYQQKRKKYLIKDYSTDQKELIAFLRKELKKTKKLK